MIWTYATVINTGHWDITTMRRWNIPTQLAAIWGPRFQVHQMGDRALEVRRAIHRQQLKMVDLTSQKLRQYWESLKILSETPWGLHLQSGLLSAERLGITEQALREALGLDQ